MGWFGSTWRSGDLPMDPISHYKLAIIHGKYSKVVLHPWMQCMLSLNGSHSPHMNPWAHKTQTQRDNTPTQTYTSLWHVDQAHQKRRWPQRTICRLADLQEWANTLHLSSMTCGTASRRSRVAPPTIGRLANLPRWSSNLHHHLHAAMHTSTCSIALNHWSNDDLIQRQQEDITWIVDVVLEETLLHLHYK